MTKSERIRSLARDGMSTADIARHLGIRYQHAYKVLKRSNMLPASRVAVNPTKKRSVPPVTAKKLPLPVEKLELGCFALSARWLLSDTGELTTDRPLPKAAGVYAFAKDGMVLYVGVAKGGLAHRLKFYMKPGKTQRTSQRLNRFIKAELRKGSFIDIYTAVPPNLDWNGLPIHGSAGLEIGLIKAFALPWNKQNAGS